MGYLYVICKHFKLVFKLGNFISQLLTSRPSGSTLGHVRIHASVNKEILDRLDYAYADQDRSGDIGL